MFKEFCLSSLLKNVVSIAVGTLLVACDLSLNLNSLGEKDTNITESEIPILTLAVSPYVGWMPWLLAEEEGIYKTYVDSHKVDIQVIRDSYLQAIDKFVNGEVHAIAITNIDAIAKLIREDIKADIILITSYNNGHDAILVKADTTLDIQGKTFALLQNSSRHYLLDRYLMRKQISFDAVNLSNTKKEMDMLEVFDDDSIYGVVTINPYKEVLIYEKSAQILFDSRQIPKEIIDLVIVRRDTLLEHPNFAQALLTTWFSMMERLQGNRRAITIDAMAKLMEISRDEYTKQMQEIIVNDTPTKALSAIRDQALKKTMRFVRYFVERHGLAGDEPYDRWISYAGRTPELIHFNAKPLQHFIIPPSD